LKAVHGGRKTAKSGFGRVRFAAPPPTGLFRGRSGRPAPDRDQAILKTQQIGVVSFRFDARDATLKSHFASGLNFLSVAVQPKSGGVVSRPAWKFCGSSSGGTAAFQQQVRGEAVLAPKLRLP
jgi:hypothetical protein